jgi:hypothetical protein
MDVWFSLEIKDEVDEFGGEVIYGFAKKIGLQVAGRARKSA